MGVFSSIYFSSLVLISSNIDICASKIHLRSRKLGLNKKESMIHKWKIKYWESQSGDNPVFDFIEDLSDRAQSKIYYSFTLLEEYGLDLKKPYVKKMTGHDFWELRILGNDSLRFFYVAVVSHTFLILHGFIKKSNKTPKKEIKIAVNRLNEYKLR